ncbi:DUF3857 domain-containing protein [Paraflavitalea sp. CAU 1676]|uniref:DUF3857 domain-containing protein n=1 Tax=Paraflavitalea sp. CAU 1676 TaxID=3032598 RepID=UPI0023DA3C7F|nr:DUF3857 domain-containing protein [Paraflavitalea sp. CAU 1676]MDF2189027.1 DUF3857 domain-containing protein [Paraflavitalea sp. CAU 1676]
MSNSLQKLLTLGLLACQLQAFSQTTPSIEREQWSGSNVIQKLDSKYNNESAVILLDKRRVEFIDGKDEVTSYKTLHKRIHINDDKGIERFNKVYLPVSSSNEIVDIMARTILPNGKIITVDSKNIRDLQEGEQRYKIFAMEGLEKGCEVEFYYTYKAFVSYFGREIIQNNYPVLAAQVIVVSPARLIFETKGYNQVNAASDTTIVDKRIITVNQADITGVDEEKYANYTANLKRVEYKLSYNASRSKTERVFTWNELAKRAFSIYGTYSDKEIKRVNDLISSNNWKKIEGNDATVVVAVENHLKKNFSTEENLNDESAENLEMIIRNKISSHRGILRLYGAVFKQLNIEHEFVMCGSRENFEVDRTFENWNNCDNQVIYFPKLKKYIAPTLLGMRYPLIDPSWVGTNGIFCKGTTIGNFTTALADIRRIQGEDYNWSYNNIEAKVRLDASLDTLIVQSKQLYAGYSAVYYRLSFNYGPAEQQQEMLKEMAKFGTNSERVITSKVENKEMESIRENKPFVLDLQVNASELVDRAGNKVLVKIGEIIGPQAQMYQEKPRQFAMDVNYPHVLHRTIEFVLPAGYRVKNLNDLNISKVYRENDQVTMGFESSYKLEGNVVKVDVMEEYRNIHYPITQYEEFKKIINAAADFNKVTLVLEPQ